MTKDNKGSRESFEKELGYALNQLTSSAAYEHIMSALDQFLEGLESDFERNMEKPNENKVHHWIPLGKLRKIIKAHKSPHIE